MHPSTWLARRWWLLPFLLVVSAGSIAVNIGDEPQVVLGICAGLAVLAVDWWLPAVLLNGVLVGTYFATGGDNGPVLFTLVVAAFLAAMCARPQQWLPLVVVSGIAVWAGLLARGIRQDDLDVSLWQSMGVGALVAAAAAVATSARARQAAHREQLGRVAADEKLRMAQELHDGVGHGLAVIAMQAGVALHVLDRDPAAARGSLEAIRDTSREALESLRAELSQITGRPAPRTPRRGLADLDALVDRVRSAGLLVDVHGGAGGPLPAAVDATAYVVVQESLTNVLRHASARSVRVDLSRGEDTLTVTVTDDGRGGPVHDEGMGLRGMRERVGALGGALSAGPGASGESPGGGFRVRVTLPVVLPVTR